MKASHKNVDSLAAIVNRELKKNKRPAKESVFRSLWIPSFRSFFIIFLFVFLFAVLSYLFEWIFGNSIYYQNIIAFLNTAANTDRLIALHTGIGAVLIGLAFFVAQSLTDTNDPDKGRVLLYKSHFFPLLTAEVLIFFIFIWRSANFLALLAIGILALSIIYFLGATINILVKDYEMEKAKTKMFFAVLRSNFIKILDQESGKRTGKNHMYKEKERIEKETNGLVRLARFGIDDNSSKYISILADTSGIVTDISLRELERLIAKIKEIASKHKKYNVNTPEITEQSTLISKQETMVYIRPQFLGNTSEISNELIQIKEGLFNEESKIEDKESIKKIAQRVFTIQEFEIEKEARLEISKIKDRCLKAINKQETGELGKILDLYVDLAQEFYTYLDGAVFSSEQAEKERSFSLEALLFKTHNPLEWLSRDIREIFTKGIQSDNINVIKEVAYLPIRLTRKAIEHNDHLIFQEFIDLPEWLYSFAYGRKQTNKNISEFMFDRTWEGLEGLSYHLELKLKKNTSDKKNFTDYAIHLLKVFQGLIKLSFDRRDFESFQTFLSKTNDLFRNLSQYYHPRKEAQIFNEINKIRQEMFLGITSWVLFITESNKDDIEKKYFETCSKYLPSDIKELTEVFLKAYGYDVGSFWGWNYWEEGKSEDTSHAHQVTTLVKLRKVYAIQFLKALQSKNDQEIENIELPHTRELSSLAEKIGGALEILEDIKSNPENWKFVLSDQEISKVDKFRELLEKTKKGQKEEGLQRKREAKVSEERIKKFKENVVKNFYETHGIRNVLRHYELVIDKSHKSYKGEITRLEINTLFDKDIFFDDSVEWHVQFIGLGYKNGSNFARGLINGENSDIIKTLQEKLNLIKKEELDSQLAKYEPKNTLIISVNEAARIFFHGNKNYTPERQLATKKPYPIEIAGVYTFRDQMIPVYEIYDNSSKSKTIFGLDKDNLGQIVQYSPLEKDESKELQQDILYMDVGIFTDDSDLMKEFLDKPPNWLNKIGDQDAQKKYLKESVVIKVCERFEFKLAEEVKGFKINIEK